MAALLDVLSMPPSYERLVGTWNLDGEDATRTIIWLMGRLLATFEDGAPPSRTRTSTRSQG